MGANSYVCRSHRGKTGSRVKQFEADHIPSTFLKALFHKFYLVLSWILCTTWSMNFFLVILIMKSLDNECVLLGTLRKFKDSFFYRTLLVAASRLTKVRQIVFYQGPLPKLLTIANLQHAAQRIWTRLESTFWLCQMKFCSNDN